ncbi:unnamed protein product, partial [Meganyctiphanes norvegica]
PKCITTDVCKSVDSVEGICTADSRCPNQYIELNTNSGVPCFHPGLYELGHLLAIPDCICCTEGCVDNPNCLNLGGSCLPEAVCAGLEIDREACDVPGIDCVCCLPKPPPTPPPPPPPTG